MRFHLSEEQGAIQDAIRGTLADSLPSEKLHKLIDGEAEFDRESWDALMALGLGGLMLPEQFGGSGLGLLDAALSAEVGGEGAVSGPLIGQIATGLAIAESDDDDAKSAWLPKLATGDAVATLAFGRDWLPESWDVSAVGNRVSGSVRFVQAATTADVYLVGLAGGKLALVEAGEHVEVQPLESFDRTRRQSTVIFNSAPATLLSADSGRIFDVALILAAADALGGAQKALDMTVAYAKEREQFGQPIGQFQALKHQIAQMALEVEPARALVWYAAYAFDKGLDDARRAAAIANAHLSDRFVSIGRAAVAAHGGIGYTWEYDLSIWFRRSIYSRAYLGGPAVHRERAAQLANW
jgi:alkylation response protein AidB-like acyl-CoA dehydrogenase